uniref:Uncharacterized protein n=1 Tax=Rousettus aegyptiacus TaxID=9407 RepID=A0A7J8BFK5_ROUAE|nr:hypothetical protein HJG63_009868 [Rousettus aegyptiacus]
MSFIIFIFIAFIKVIKTAERFGLSRETVFGSSTEAGLRWLAGTEVGRLAGKKRRRGRQEETVKLLNLHLRAPDEVRGARGRAGHTQGERGGHPVPRLENLLQACSCACSTLETSRYLEFRSKSVLTKKSL